jgi:DMSO/TMAO reductase YedYZ molybdopterin-dependent catalytic subunit
VDVDPRRVPPGQYVTNDFPVLSAGPPPHTPLDRWTFTVRGAVDDTASWTWDEFRALPSEVFRRDIHCVTTWSKLETTWTGVSIDALLSTVEVEGDSFLRSAMAATRPTSRSRTSSTARPGFWERYGYRNYGDPWREQRHQGD